GFGQAAALPGIAQVLSLWFPQATRGRATGLIAASMQVGGVINAWTTGWLLARFSLMGFFWVLAVPGFVWAIVFWFWFRDNPREFSILSPMEAAELPIPHHQQGGAGDFSWWKLVSSPVLWLICGQQFCRAAGYIFFASWYATYLQETRLFTVKQSGFATGWTLFGFLIGALVGGAVSDWILHYTGRVRLARQGVAIVSMSAVALCFAAIFAVSGHDALAAVLVTSLMTLGAFFAGVGGPAGYTVTMDVSGKSVALVFGFMNMAGNIGAALLILIVPWLLGPSRNQWDLVIVVFVALYFSAAIFWSLIQSGRTVFGQA
ncbi:MAG: sauU 3, partial [Planctomycetaceae bacterium]|nr:sauU 3 [Planctomycetaceae bacterium]